MLGQLDIAESEKDNIKAFYHDGTIYVTKKENFCVQNLLHELFHSLQSPSWHDLEILKEGLTEFISAYFLYLHKSDPGFKTSLNCALKKGNRPCSLKDRPGYSKGYSVWATIYSYLKHSGQNYDFEMFLDLLKTFNSYNHVINEFLIKVKNKNASSEGTFLRNPCKYLEYFGQTGNDLIEQCENRYHNVDFNVFEE